MPDRAVEELVSNVTSALSQGLPKRDLFAMLARLVKSATPGSPEELFAKLELAELVVREDPFRAARLALDVLRAGPDARAYGVLGIAHSLLGAFRAARRAHEQAVALAPEHPGYRHNLGHLLNVAFDQPAQALVHLLFAYEGAPEEPEIGSSYAHALVRAGQAAKAVFVLEKALGWSHEAAEELVGAWREGRTLRTP